MALRGWWTVLCTYDGGKDWQSCVVPPDAEKLDFRGIQAFDENTAIVMSSGPGNQSRLYKTIDGCQTWKLLFTNPDKSGFWDALSLHWPTRDLLGRVLDSSHGYGYLLGNPVGGNFVLFSTNDSGEHWHQRISAQRGPKGEGCKVDEFAAQPSETAFAASNQSLLALNGTYLLFVSRRGGSALDCVHRLTVYRAKDIWWLHSSRPRTCRSDAFSEHLFRPELTTLGLLSGMPSMVRL